MAEEIEFNKGDFEDPAIMSSEQVEELSRQFAQKTISCLNEEIAAFNAPMPLSVVLNALMFVYMSTVINYIPKTIRKDIVSDHFGKVIKDLTHGEKT